MKALRLFIFILMSLATAAQADLPTTKRALPRLTQDRIFTPIPQTEAVDCSEIIQKGIKEFYGQKNNQETRNEASTATVFADSLPVSFPYADYINTRVAEKERPADREKLREEGLKLYQEHGRGFLPKDFLEHASSVILDPSGQIRGLAFFSLQKFIDLFQANGKYYFLAYYMDSISISAQESEENVDGRLEKALKILQELAHEGGMRNLRLSLEGWTESSLFATDAIQRHPKLLSNLNHLSFNPGGGLRIPPQLRFNGIPSVAFENMYFESENQVLNTGESPSELILRYSPVLSRVNLLSLIKNPLGLKHLSVASGPGAEMPPITSVSDLLRFQNLTHLAAEVGSFYGPGRFPIQNTVDLIEKLPNLTHIAFTPEIGESLEEIVELLKKIKSPSIKEIGLFRKGSADTDEMLEREGLPPIRLVGQDHIHW